MKGRPPSRWPRKRTILAPALALLLLLPWLLDMKPVRQEATRFGEALTRGSNHAANLIAPDVAPPTEEELSRCRAEIRRLRTLPALAGTPVLDERRAALLARHKSEPVIFLRPPEYAPSSDAVVRAHRQRLEKTRFPADVVSQSVSRYIYRPDLGRQVLLREGYLYGESDSLLRGIVAHVRVEHMFDAPKIWIQRGGRTVSAVLDKRTKHYRYDEGPDAGERVRVLPFDRIVSEREALDSPIHRELRSLRNRLGFERFRVERITEEGIVADLRYGNLWVSTVLGGAGPGLEKVCEAVDPDHEQRLVKFRAQAMRRLELVHTLRQVTLAQVREGLPFDEPKTEYGQQDGKLRPRWENAYAWGRAGFRFQGDWYSVFSPDGSPHVPQVCVDFLFDTLERASGAWWQTESSPRERTVGRFDRGAFGLANPRSINEFVAFAAQNPSQFDFLDVPPVHRVEFQYQRKFLGYLTEHADDFVPGDIVIIKGYLPRPGDRRYDIMHYHSVYVYETDPVSGVPTLLVGNSGVPRLTSWRYEMDRTPRRAIYYRIRLRTEWLETFVSEAPGNPLDPPPILVSGPFGIQ